MNTQDIQDKLQEIIDIAVENSIVDEDEQVPAEFNNARYTTSFVDAGVLTDNKGLIIKMTDGSEFQISIVKSR
jgi:hypothetical protein